MSTIQIVKSIDAVRRNVKEWRKRGLSIGFVPTMGFLHEGHKSLIDRAVIENDKVIVSVFVNPTQFGPKEDLNTYPRDIENDAALCKNSGAALIFNPESEEMYSNNYSTYIDVQRLTGGLCGAKREGHFRGVCTVVSKLFNIVHPDKAYFGEKDAQQLAVIKRMVEDLNTDIDIIGCPIVREKDGLAMSSRNTYLSSDERKAALVLNKSLSNAKQLLKDGEKDSKIIANTIQDQILNEPLAKIDYIEVVDSKTLQPISEIKDSVLVAIAVYIGKTRLIDNFTFNIK